MHNQITTDLHFDYLNKEEAIYLLGLLRHTECSNCPSFYLGCDGNYTPIQTANMSLREYLYNSKKGTEPFLCGKLRTLLTWEEVRIKELNDMYDFTIKKDIGFLTKNFDKCILGTSNYALELKNIEIAYQQQLQKIIEEYTKQILKLQVTVHDQQVLINNQGITTTDENKQQSHNTINSTTAATCT